ncbi:BatD family protein [Bdellovibrionota bacterium FG-2]
MSFCSHWINLTVFLALGAAPVFAKDVVLSAELDRQEISIDESVSLKLSVTVEGDSNASQPRFSAPNFEVINQFQNTFVQSFYENGRFGMRNQVNITKVLRPLKSGDLQITGIQVSIDGKNHTSPDLRVRVLPGASSPSGGSANSGAGVSGPARVTGKRPAGAYIFVRAEVDKERAVKGEQVVVSYYLYRRVRVFNIQVEKYPVLPGFLREDMEMPILNQRLDSERVILDGIAFERSLLLRYAAYPIQEGKLKIDPLSLKYQHYTNTQSMDNNDPFMNFFQQMTPHVGSSRSDTVSVDVVPVPEEGRPPSFSGAVGDFSVVSALDKNEVRANEAVTLTVKIEGRGNLASIKDPQAKWPENVELYDTKGTAKTGRSGVGEKVFEILLIPRAPGKLTLPGLEFSFFDPSKKAYVTKSTAPIDLQVAEGAPGSVVPQRAPPSQANQQGVQAQSGVGAPAGAPLASKVIEIRDLKGPEEKTESISVNGFPVWRWLYWGACVGFTVLLMFVGLDLIRKVKTKVNDPESASNKQKHVLRTFSELRKMSRQVLSGTAWLEVVGGYEKICGQVFDALDRYSEIGARSLSRDELRRILVDEQGLSDDAWKRTEKLLEFAEMVRFASSAGAVSESSARNEFGKWVGEAEALVKTLDSISKKKLNRS